MEEVELTRADNMTDEQVINVVVVMAAK